MLGAFQIFVSEAGPIQTYGIRWQMNELEIAIYRFKKL